MFRNENRVAVQNIRRASLNIGLPHVVRPVRHLHNLRPHRRVDNPHRRATNTLKAAVHGRHIIPLKVARCRITNADSRISVQNTERFTNARATQNIALIASRNSHREQATQEGFNGERRIFNQFVFHFRQATNLVQTPIQLAELGFRLSERSARSRVRSRNASSISGLTRASSRREILVKSRIRAALTSHRNMLNTTVNLILLRSNLQEICAIFLWNQESTRNTRAFAQVLSRAINTSQTLLIATLYSYQEIAKILNIGILHATIGGHITSLSSGSAFKNTHNFCETSFKSIQLCLNSPYLASASSFLLNVITHFFLRYNRNIFKIFRNIFFIFNRRLNIWHWLFTLCALK